MVLIKTKMKKLPRSCSNCKFYKSMYKNYKMKNEGSSCLAISSRGYGGKVIYKDIESTDGVSYSRQSRCPLILMDDNQID